MLNDPSVLARTAMEVSNLYGFLATLFREEVSPDMLNHLRSVEIRESLSDAEITFDENFFQAESELLLEELAVEFTGLFLGPGEHISPHESIHLGDSRALWGEETKAVKRFIESIGFEYREDYSGIPDHICVELELMAELSRREAQAWESGDTSAAKNCLDYQKEFLTEHLGKWIGKFADRITETADHIFYKDIARFAADFVESEIQDVESRRQAAGSKPNGGGSGPDKPAQEALA